MINRKVWLDFSDAYICIVQKVATPFISFILLFVLPTWPKLSSLKTLAFPTRIIWLSA